MGWLRNWRSGSAALAVPTFGGLADNDPNSRMEALEGLLCLCLGPRKEAYGGTATELERTPLPAPLRRFYAIAGRWPSPYPDRAPILFESPDESLFYAGIANAHLAALDQLKTTRDGRLALFSEQSGNWTAETETEGSDPPVWLRGTLGSGRLADPLKSQETLSGWVVTHTLTVIAWEAANSCLCATAPHNRPPDRVRMARTGLSEWFNGHARDTHMLWTSHLEPEELSGKLYLLPSFVLVHKSGSFLRLAALTTDAARELRRHAAAGDILE